MRRIEVFKETKPEALARKTLAHIGDGDVLWAKHARASTAIVEAAKLVNAEQPRLWHFKGETRGEVWVLWSAVVGGRGGWYQTRAEGEHFRVAVDEAGEPVVNEAGEVVAVPAVPDDGGSSA